MEYPSLLFQTTDHNLSLQSSKLSVKTMVFHTLQLVKIVKSALRQPTRHTSEDADTTLPRFLLRYHITPHTTTRESPSVLLYGRQLRTRLDLYRPSVSDNASQNQQH